MVALGMSQDKGFFVTQRDPLQLKMRHSLYLHPLRWRQLQFPPFLGLRQ